MSEAFGSELTEQELKIAGPIANLAGIFYAMQLKAAITHFDNAKFKGLDKYMSFFDAYAFGILNCVLPQNQIAWYKIPHVMTDFLEGFKSNSPFDISKRRELILDAGVEPGLKELVDAGKDSARGLVYLREHEMEGRSDDMAKALTAAITMHVLNSM